MRAFGYSFLSVIDCVKFVRAPGPGRRHRVAFLHRRAVAVTETEFLAAAAGAGLIRSAPRVIGGDRGHHLGRRAPLANQLGHCFESRPRMHEKMLEPRTQVVLPRFAVARECETILGTAAVAPVPHLAALTLGRQSIALVLSEL